MRCVAFDIGETLVCDDRHWGSWADWLGVPRHTVSALVGAVVAQGRDNADALRLIRPGLDIAAEYAAREAAGRGEHLGESDLYDDVRPTLRALRERGLRVVVAGNQTVRAGELLRALELPVDALATSGEWGVAKPADRFWQRLVELAEVRAPAEILYIGDHPSRDTFPAAAAGLRTAHLRRGPWGHYWAPDPAVRRAATWSIDTLQDVLTLPLETPVGE
ncbi:HAD family hydrolase [Streptomyces bohaiensis]|uniref:HAD family hydrolase n=1 Tax=Streptomyces bohaiensis TaxID=1431344 RepID=A0ABX1CDA7_9ACTN|nr:HAD family hydrolase [Streptomyces bohaiensis]